MRAKVLLPASLLVIASVAAAQSSGAKPTVVSTDPANSAVNVSRALQCFSITFSEPMNTICGAVTSGWVGAAGSGSSCQWSTDKMTMTVCRENTGSTLIAGSQVQASLNPAGMSPWIADADGNFLDAFSFSFTVEMGSAGLVQVPADPGKGFNWPYYLYTPATIKRPAILMVEPNNTGYTSDDQNVHDRAAASLINSKKPWADDLGAPYLVPTFPRPATNWKVYTQSLDRDTLLTNLPGLVRIDLQLVAMIDDARARLAAKGIDVDRKVWMVGYSASASFTGRFTALHPDRIKAASFGSGGSYPIVPVAGWKGKTLRYPVGVADLEALTGQKFNETVFRTVPIQCYMGDQDLDDALNYADGYEPEDAALIKEVFGGPPPFLRWPAAEAAYISVGSLCQFVVFPGMRHQWPAWSFLKEFFEHNRSEPFPPPLPKPLNYHLYFPHVASFDQWETEIALTNTSEGPIRGELRAFKADGGDPIETIPVDIPGSGRLETTVGKAFRNARDIAYMSMISDSGFLAGYTRFSQPGNRVSLPMVDGITDGWFNKVETDGWTGIAFLNVDSGPADVSLLAFDDHGDQVTSRTLTLAPGQKYVGMVSQLFTDVDVSMLRFFKFSSDKKLVGFTVSSSADGLMLDGLNSLEGYIRQR
jgi:pimeloyl-ACP methyl ester carboxylesterase